MGKAANSLAAALLTGVALLGASCASPNVNPPSAKAHRGYVDFYVPGQTNLYWDVKVRAPEGGGFKTVFSKLQPLPDGVLRLELESGPQQFQIAFLNRLIEAPLTLPVVVQEGMVTPVKVELVPVTETSLLSKQQQVGPNISGAGRKTRYSSQAGTVERLVASVQASVPYRLKQQMHYPP
jgi:hypothetical protein